VSARVPPSGHIKAPEQHFAPDRNHFANLSVRAFDVYLLDAQLTKNDMDAHRVPHEISAVMKTQLLHKAILVKGHGTIGRIEQTGGLLYRVAFG
jgi:uncharacterized surface protein with fasciclin (FAS1) repeats